MHRTTPIPRISTTQRANTCSWTMDFRARFCQSQVGLATRPATSTRFLTCHPTWSCHRRIGVSGSSAGSLISYWIGTKKPKEISLIGASHQALGTQFILPKMGKNLAPSIIYQPHPESDRLHAPKFAQMIKDKCDKLGVTCVIYGSDKNKLPQLPEGKDKYAVTLAFYRKTWNLK